MNEMKGIAIYRRMARGRPQNDRGMAAGRPQNDHGMATGRPRIRHKNKCKTRIKKNNKIGINGIRIGPQKLEKMLAN